MGGIRYRVADPLGRPIVLNEARWSHVQEERPGFGENVIATTLQAPQMIVISNKIPTSDVYYLLGGDPKRPQFYAVVVVSFRTPIGVVVTAMHQKRPHGGDFERGIRYVSRKL